jgi:hypothetical protein
LTAESREAEYGRIDNILLSSKSDNDSDRAPLAIIEFGLWCREWWAKLDQLSKYLQRMIDSPSDQTKYKIEFKRPLLFAVATFEDSKAHPNAPECKLRLGVFFCTPKEDDTFRMTLLWKSETDTLQTNTAAFGKFLQIAFAFGDVRKEQESTNFYEYFSSNCCKIGDHIVSVCVCVCQRILRVSI